MYIFPVHLQCLSFSLASEQTPRLLAVVQMSSLLHFWLSESNAIQYMICLFHCQQTEHIQFKMCKNLFTRGHLHIRFPKSWSRPRSRLDRDDARFSASFNLSLSLLLFSRRDRHQVNEQFLTSGPTLALVVLRFRPIYSTLSYLFTMDRHIHVQIVSHRVEDSESPGLILLAQISIS